MYLIWYFMVHKSHFFQHGCNPEIAQGQSKTLVCLCHQQEGCAGAWRCTSLWRLYPTSVAVHGRISMLAEPCQNRGPGVGVGGGRRDEFWSWRRVGERWFWVGRWGAESEVGTQHIFRIYNYGLVMLDSFHNWWLEESWCIPAPTKYFFLLESPHCIAGPLLMYLDLQNFASWKIQNSVVKQLQSPACHMMAVFYKITKVNLLWHC